MLNVLASAYVKAFRIRRLWIQPPVGERMEEKHEPLDTLPLTELGHQTLEHADQLRVCPKGPRRQLLPRLQLPLTRGSPLQLALA